MITTICDLQIIIFATLHSHANHFFTFSLFSSSESEIFFHFFFCSIKEKMVVEKFFLDSPIFELKGFFECHTFIGNFFLNVWIKCAKSKMKLFSFLILYIGPLGKVKKVIIMRKNWNSLLYFCCKLLNTCLLNIMETRGQFHQHFKSSICAYIFVSKKYKPKM